MKIIALIVIAILFWSSDDARRIAADGLNNTAEIVNPDTTNKINISFCDYAQRSKNFRHYLQTTLHR